MNQTIMNQTINPQKNPEPAETHSIKLHFTVPPSKLIPHAQSTPLPEIN